MQDKNEKQMPVSEKLQLSLAKVDTTRARQVVARVQRLRREGLVPTPHYDVSNGDVSFHGILWREK